MMNLRSPNRTLAQLSHAELIRVLAENPQNHVVMQEFLARYDALIRRKVAGAMLVKTAPAGCEGRSFFIDDVVNEVYCRLFRRDCRALRACKNRYQHSFLAYLRAICLNVARNHMRNEARKHDFFPRDSFSEPIEQANFSAGAVEWRLLEDGIRVKFCRSFRAGCAHRNFIIFKLRFLYGYQHQEIARIKALGLGSQGVANTAVRIRKRLLKEFTNGRAHETLA